MVYLMVTLLLQGGTSTPSWPSGWALIGWVVAAVVAAVYLFSGISEKLLSGRKELVEVGDKRITNLTREKDEVTFKLNELQKRYEALEKEKNEIEKDKTMLMREHHQLLEISVADLNSLKSQAKYIEQIEEENNRYREEKGLPPKQRNPKV
jgi:chromosome segregation ATPase